MSISASLKSLSHHAHLLIGSQPAQSELILVLEKHHKIPRQANPDFFARAYQTLTVDDAREIKSLHSTRPIGSTGKKIFILTMNAATIEAQNALLKLLEEPAEYAHFFLIVPSAHLLLPTVKSRLLHIEMKEGGVTASNEAHDELKSDAKKFIKMPPAKRLEVIKKFIEDIAKEKKVKQDAINFLDAVQEIVYKEHGAAKGKASLEALEVARTYMNDRAPSLKMLMEYVALNVS